MHLCPAPRLPTTILGHHSSPPTNPYTPPERPPTAVGVLVPAGPRGRTDEKWSDPSLVRPTPGTLGYMCPEYAHEWDAGKRPPATAKGDLYGMGVVMAELICGEPAQQVCICRAPRAAGAQPNQPACNRRLRGDGAGMVARLVLPYV